ncbi:MAG TPA: formate dehydrogenase accessory sulfurtransferase FdhD [Terriglobales bacterium]|nr:formate dehydrogenase accessory sulfurtransferase FdhD [Terriglobales bacterium]
MLDDVPGSLVDLTASKISNERSIALTSVEQWEDGAIQQVQDYLAVEEPLEIRIGEVPLSVTMRTPGHDLELAAGFLFTEGIIANAAELKDIQQVTTASAGNAISAELENSFDPGKLQRNFFAASSCGICGKQAIEAIRVRGVQPLNSGFRVDSELLCSLPEKLSQSQAVFGRTGGLHAAALFSASGEMLVLREDIGRHNAVDKVVGWALQQKRLPLNQHALMVSGRGGFEIVQKTIVAGIPVLASVSAPSSLAVQLAREMGLTLVGFLRGKRFVVYSGSQRIKNLG